MHPRAHHPRWPLLLTALLAAALLTAAVLHTSLQRGRLAFYPRMDDVMYLARGAELTRAVEKGWQQGGLFESINALASDWKREPPHSPWGSGAAALSFATLGYQEYTAYFPTALPVLAFLLCVARISRHAGGRFNWRAHALIIFAATAPFLAASVYILKPDYAAGICTAIAMMLALRGPLLAARWQRLTWMGALLGLALLAKPAMMLPTAMLAVGTLTLCTIRDLSLARWQHAPSHRQLLRAPRPFLIVLTTAALIAAPHFTFALRSEWAYTRGTLTGQGINMWGYRGTHLQHATYYLTGPGGRLMLDGARSLAPLGLALIFYAAITLAPRSRRSPRRITYLLCTLAALGMAWTGPTISTVKIQQFASCFSALLWLTGIHVAAGLCRAARPQHNRKVRLYEPSAQAEVGSGTPANVPCSRSGLVTRTVQLPHAPPSLTTPRGFLRRPLIANLLILAMLTTGFITSRWTFPLWPADPRAPARIARDAREKLVRDTYESIRAQTTTGATSILVAGGQYDLAGPLLRLWSIRDNITLREAALQRTPDTTIKAEAERRGRASFDNYDLLLVGQSVARKDIPTVVQSDADEFYLTLAQSDPRFQLISRTTDQTSGAAFELYRRLANP